MKGRILLLEDDVFVANMLRGYLEGSEFLVDIFNAVDDAFASLQSTSYAVLVSDVRLVPGTFFDSARTYFGQETGLAFASHAKAKLPSLPIILFSAVESRAVNDWCSSTGSTFYLKGEINRRDFRNSVLSTARASLTARLERLEGPFSKYSRAVSLLTNRSNNKPPFVIQDEYDVQDLLYMLLSTHFEDIRREQAAPEIMGAGSRVDIVIRDLRVGIEVKFLGSHLTEKRLMEQIVIDQTRYQALQDCDTVIFFIYDPLHRINNEAGLLADFYKSSAGSMSFTFRVVH